MVTIEQMRLNPVSRAAAIELQQRCPFVVFTSGRRDRWAQAVAMAQNSIVDRHWVGATYLRAAPFQTWLDVHHEARTAEQIAHGFLTIMDAMPNEELEQISKHLGGNAFDVLPLVRDAAGTPTEEGQTIIDVIRQLPGLDKFLAREGKLVRWHAQFHESAEV